MSDGNGIYSLAQLTEEPVVVPPRDGDNPPPPQVFLPQQGYRDDAHEMIRTTSSNAITMDASNNTSLLNYLSKTSKNVRRNYENTPSGHHGQFATSRRENVYMSGEKRKIKRLLKFERSSSTLRMNGYMVTLALGLLTMQILFSCLGGIFSAAAKDLDPSTTGPQHFRRTPNNQTATLGEIVTLKCNVQNKVGMLQWTVDGFGLGTSKDMEGFDRYSMKIDEDEGDFDLEIYPVTLEDDAIYQCQVSPDADGRFELRSENAKLTVEVPASPPEISHGDSVQATELKELELECISRGGKPAAEIAWFDGTGREIKSGVRVVNEPFGDGNRFNTRSSLSLRPTKEHHNKTFTCQAHNQNDKDVMSTHIRLEVMYAPVVTVTVQSIVIREYDNARVSCHAAAHPPEISFTWFFNDQILDGVHGPLLILQNVSRISHNGIVRCQVENSVGRSEGSKHISVIYGPVFRTRPRDLQADWGTSATFNCDVDGNPRPVIAWIYEPTGAVVSNADTYTTTLAQNTHGAYICQAHLEGFPGISAEATIRLRGPPVIVSQRVHFPKEEDSIRIECLAKSAHLPVSITWTHLGRAIDWNNSDSDYSVLEKSIPNGKQSVLVVRSSQEDDVGPYTCTVANSYGVHIMEIVLVQQNKGQLMIILTCVIGSILAVAAITLITLFCHKKSKTPVSLKPVDGDTLTKPTVPSSKDLDVELEITGASSVPTTAGNDSEHCGEGYDALNNHCGYQEAGPIAPVITSEQGDRNSDNRFGMRKGLETMISSGRTPSPLIMFPSQLQLKPGTMSTQV